MNLLCALLFVLLAATAYAAEPVWIEGSTEPLLQLTGEKAQYQAHGKSTAPRTRNATLTALGLAGSDLGVPVAFPSKIVLVFGDSWGFRQDGERRWVWTPGWGKDDSMAYFDRPVDFGACRTITDFDRKLSTQNEPVEPDYSSAPELKFFVKPDPGAPFPRFAPTRIANLRPGQGLGEFEVPTGAFALDDKLYVFYNVKHQQQTEPGGKRTVYFLNSILARADGPSAAWTASSPPLLKRLYDVSEHPALADVHAPPDDTRGPGKFIHVAPVVLDAPALGKIGIRERLPEPLRNSERLVFMWGSSWKYVRSDLYLAVVDAKDIDAIIDGERDASKWWYCSGIDGGNPAWTHDETAAAPLIGNWSPSAEPCLGEHSVVWNPVLGRFLLAYQEQYTSIRMRTAAAPWGPWSAPVRVFGKGDPLALKFIRHEGKNTITNNPVETFRPDGKPFLVPDKHGATYGPYLFEECTRGSDGRVNLYFTMSCWNPYQVFLMKTSFKVE
ncbi:MAG: hypothetical protein AMXMBFR7_10170 [Planctomycetota bacterium]